MNGDRARLTARGIRKEFPGTCALDSVDVEIAPGEIHALVGENGAGKSTLSRILAGALEADGGTVLLDGEPVRWRGPEQALARGVVLVPQEIMLVPRLSVADNVWLGTRRGAPRDAEERLDTALRRLGAQFSPSVLVTQLDRPSRQLVQLARGLCLGSSALLLDEPTEGLTADTYDRLRTILHEEAANATATVYVSHRLAEILRLADRISVLRDGRLVETFDSAATNERELIRAMAGHYIGPLEGSRDRPGTAPTTTLLDVWGLTGNGFRNVSLSVTAGEIVGLAGVPGSGKSELLRAMGGADSYSAGELRICGKEVRPGSTAAALEGGAAYLPADRIHEGVIGIASVRTNVVLSERKRTVRRGLRLRHAEKQHTSSLVDRLRIQTPAVDTEVRALSGGNQQKVLIARLMLGGARVWLLDEPTRGVDVAGKAEIHRLLREAACAGDAVVVASSEMKELIDLVDRIIVMRMGEPVGEVASERADPEEILYLSLPEPVGG